MSEAPLSSDQEFNALPEHGWTCFHCGEHFAPTFAGQRAARNHFGQTPHCEPGCLLKLTSRDKTLLSALRAYQDGDRRRAEEDTDLHRALAAKAAEMATAVRAAEEQGYARGLEDAKKYPETLGLTRATT